MSIATRAIVLDIEGTTTPISFVHDVLFPYALQRMPEVLRAQHASPEYAELIQEAARIQGVATLDLEFAIALFQSWSRADRKLTPLKALQGLIWTWGYQEGSLRAPVYPDVLPALRVWKADGLSIHIYSSGSIEAQRLLFAHTVEGDLTPWLSGYFDTTSGAKAEIASYHNIQRALNLPAAALLFLSDNVREIAAARAAGWQAILVERDGPAVGREPPAVSSFADILTAPIPVV